MKNSFSKKKFKRRRIDHAKETHGAKEKTFYPTRAAGLAKRYATAFCRGAAAGLAGSCALFTFDEK